MARRPVTYDIFRVVFVHREPQLLSIWHLLRDVVRPRRLDSVAAIVFIVSTVVFALAFPTLASAMSGYAVVTKSFVSVNGNLVPFATAELMPYIIHDGARINKSSNYRVSFPPRRELEGR